MYPVRPSFHNLTAPKVLCSEFGFYSQYVGVELSYLPLFLPYSTPLLWLQLWLFHCTSSSSAGSEEESFLSTIETEMSLWNLTQTFNKGPMFNVNSEVTVGTNVTVYFIEFCMFCFILCAVL